MEYFLKLIITSILIITITEISKKSSIIAALLASLPLTSIIAIIWLYVDTKSTEQVANLSIGVFWLVLPSLVFFIALPVLLKRSYGFYLSMLSALILTIVCYLSMLGILKLFGVKI